MMPQEPPVSVTFYAYFATSKMFEARALAMELGEKGLITQVTQSQKGDQWCLQAYFRCVPHSEEFDKAARYIEDRVTARGGQFDCWEYPVDGVEFDCPGDWQDVELFPIQTLTAKSGAQYRIKIDL